MKDILSRLVKGERLSSEEAKNVMFKIGKGEVNNAQLAAFLTVFLMRDITVDEFSGFRESLIEMSLQTDLEEENCIDIVGTGGDGKNTFNISTASCFVVAGSGYKVTKHGNYASSSVSGSSNVLEYLGYKFTNDKDVLRKQLEEANLTFLHAPLFHPALKNVAPVRKELGLKTVFNMLGPVVNPSKPKHQLLGVFNEKAGKLYSELLKKANINHIVVYSVDGYDEISLTGDFEIITNGKIKTYSPEDIGFNKINPEEIWGGNSVKEAAGILTNVLTGNATDAQKNVVLVNSAFAIKTISGKSFDESLDLAKDSLLSKKALNVFKKLVE